MLLITKYTTMRHSATVLFFALFLTTNLVGQIYCPTDITASCFSSLTLEECGNAIVVSGNYNSSQVKFVDDKQVNACNEGIVFRKFYIDADYSNSFTEGELHCFQTITLTYNELPLNIQYPSEVVLNCLGEVPNQSPTWSSHPCDLVGYTYEDEIFEFEAGACFKIVRTFTVINWCEYEGNTGVGLYTGIQIIKIIDDEAPEIQNCEDLVFEALENCETTVTLNNIANDAGDCPSGLLQWTLSVDLWADGIEDLYYGPNEPQPFKLDEIQNGEELSITLPENVGIANHKLVWKVTDGCGNVRSCSSRFEVKDNKPPTPYCLNFLSATLNGEDGGQLIIPVELFDNGAIDNCSSKEEIRISFSENIEDTERIIECGEIGFQFYRIYYTDAAGNQDFCEVFMFVLDNGSCAGKFEPEGKIVTRQGLPIEDVSTYLMDEDDMISQSSTSEGGLFTFGEQSLMETYFAKAQKDEDPMLGVDILDFQLMLDGALGKSNLDYYQKIAADINEDGQFDLIDLKLFRDVLYGEVELSSEDSWKFIPVSQNTNSIDAVFNSELSIMDYHFGFNFYGVKKGDLTAAENINEQSQIQNVELVLKIENDRVVITNPQSIETGFFSIDLDIDVDLITNNLSSGNLYELNSSTRFINVSEEYLTLHPNDLSLAINYSSSEDASFIKNELIKSVSLMNESHDGLIKIDWLIIDQRDNNPAITLEEDLSILHATFFQDQLIVKGKNINSIKMTSLSGQLINTSVYLEGNGATITLDSFIPNGVYFLSVNSSFDEQVIKVVKI
ncbi:MAG: hypothetical protein ACJATI_002766 [Halioglobus sp.]|jgi:hypothetical protein